MLIGKNKQNKIVNILDSVSEGVYTCPICHEELIRNFGAERQYFSHPKGKGDDCEWKVKEFLNKNVQITDKDVELLDKEYFKKEFEDIKVEMSDCLSEEGYKLTKEQVEIIKSKEDRIKVSALAGSSKTTTMYYYAKENPQNKTLYLVYNSAMKKEAESTFGKLSHVNVKTCHGLAYSYVGKFYKNKLTFNYTPVDIIRDLDLDWNKDQEIAVMVGVMLKEYMLSDKDTLEQLEVYTDKEHEKYRPSILHLAHKLWELKKEYKNDVKIEHDFYLKLFQLSKKDLSNMYDCIILDEAQDSNLLTYDMIKNSNVNGIVFIGDKYQQMYGWRNAFNILDIFDAKEYKLTTSFRVSQNIANVANLLVQDVTGEEIGMTGFNTKQHIVHQIDVKKHYACLARTNSALFDEVMLAIKNGKRKLFFEGGFDSYKFNNIKDAYFFSMGHITKNPILSKFKNYGSMVEYAEKNDDMELLSLIRTVDHYGADIPKLVDGVKNNTCRYKNESDIIFTTCHRAKGQTYQNVKICNDYGSMNDFFNKIFIENVQDTKENKNERTRTIEKFTDECYVLYVAITRASGQIQLNDDLKNYLLLRHKFLNK